MDTFDIIKEKLPFKNLKFRIEKGDKEGDVQIYLSKESITLMYLPLLNALSDKNNQILLSEKDGYICATIRFANINVSEKFIDDYISQNTKEASNLAIVDNKTGNIVCAGFATACKHTDPVHRDMLLISLDGRNYFNLDDHPTYHFEWYDGEPIDFINPYGYKVIPWKESRYYDPMTVDVYQDHPYEEIDAEVAPLVDAMNTIPAIYTTGSCCGHGQTEMYVTFTIASLSSFNRLIQAIIATNAVCDNEFFIDVPLNYSGKHNSPLKREFMLDGKPIKCKTILNIISSDALNLTLRSKNKGLPVYKAAEILTENIINRKENVHS